MLLNKIEIVRDVTICRGEDMVNFKFKMFGNTSSKAYYEDFNHQIKLVKDVVLTLEEAIKLLERGCSNEMEDKCKIISELDKEAKLYEDKLRQCTEKDLLIGPNNIDF